MSRRFPTGPLASLTAEGYLVERAGACLRVTAPPMWGPRQVRYVMLSTLLEEDYPAVYVRGCFA